MSSIKKETSDTSPVLFLNVKGEPMRFFVRPGPTKVQLQPLITNGGGILCRTQEPNAILLADPGEISAAAEGASQFYISTQYIRDCVIQNKQLDIEGYRFSNLQPVQTRTASRKQKGAGRMGYSLEDDSAILNFIAKHQHDAKGNRVWQEMERQGITSHSWQSMKDRFLKHLQHKLPSKSPKTDKKASSPMKSFLSDNNTSRPSSKPSTPKQTPKRKAQVILFSDSDSTQISPESRPADQPDPESSPEKCSSTERPDSETNQAHTVNNEVHNEPAGDQNQESVQEGEQQQCQQDNQQHEVPTKKARMENDTSGVETSHESTKNSTASSEKGRKKQKTSRSSGRKLGILERAAREFEDSQTLDSQEDQPQSQPSSTGSETDEAQIMAARERAIREQAAITDHPSDAVQHPPEAQNLCTPELKDSAPGPNGVVAPITSNAHMFLFQQESQEDLSQPSEEERVSQDLLEAKQRVVSLMQESEKDLVEVMKALLKASGDVTLAMTYLVEGRDPEVHGPLWTKNDDEILLSADLSGREMLNEKYGAERVSNRIAFLTVE
ncbi:telomeric repeat-binding factor 2-interacting protein 1 [Trichomycterus rosablanca]|uniref:telomeric repeat-binding factor 2-interacting protein 1 n=1 Tax=Trichomycterus rosablanca TaxID=2290929 RepID=UPI002F35C139